MNPCPLLAGDPFQVFHEGTPDPLSSMTRGHDKRMDFPHPARVHRYAANPSDDAAAVVEGGPADAAGRQRFMNLPPRRFDIRPILTPSPERLMKVRRRFIHDVRPVSDDINEAQHLRLQCTR